MEDSLKPELSSFICQIVREIDERFSETEKRDLYQYLSITGLGTPEKMLTSLLEKVAPETTDSELPSNSKMESIVYSQLDTLNPLEKIGEITPAMQAAGLKFFRVLPKVALPMFSFKSDDVKDLDYRMKMVLSSIAQNEGENEMDILNFMKENNLNLNQLMKFNKDSEEMKEELMLQSSKFNVRYEIKKPEFLFNVSYDEVKTLADAYNANLPQVKIAGESINLKDVTRIKIFTITDEKAFRNESQWAANLTPSAKKFHGVGDWSYERFCQIGGDVTSKFLKPTSLQNKQPVRVVSKIKDTSEFQNVPFEIISIYNEVYQAFINKNNLLCAGGIRAILEAICKNKGIKDGIVPSNGAIPEKKTSSLKGRIYGLSQNGIITKNHSEILVHHQYLGDKALHECEKPSTSELEIAMEIISFTLTSVYELNVKGNELKSKRNLRS